MRAIRFRAAVLLAATALVSAGCIPVWDNPYDTANKPSLVLTIPQAAGCGAAVNCTAGFNEYWIVNYSVDNSAGLCSFRAVSLKIVDAWGAEVSSGTASVSVPAGSKSAPLLLYLCDCVTFVPGDTYRLHVEGDLAGSRQSRRVTLEGVFVAP